MKYKKRFRRKQDEVDAFKFYVDPMPDWFMDEVTANRITLHNCNGEELFKGVPLTPHCIVRSYDDSGEITNAHIVYKGEYIVRNDKGQIRNIRSDMFEDMYEVIEDIKTYHCKVCGVIVELKDSFLDSEETENLCGVCYNKYHKGGKKNNDKSDSGILSVLAGNSGV